MKELSIEEKAKRYDELKVTAQELEHDGCFDKLTLFDLFPELAESEDEKIRESLLEYLHTLPNHYAHSGVCVPEWIAWLEKQGEQPNKHDVCDNCEQQGSCVSPCPMKLVEKHGEQNTVVVIPKFRVGDVIRPKGSTAEYTIESIYGECYHGKGWGLHISCDNDYELVEQKPAWSEEDEIIWGMFVEMADSEPDENFYGATKERCSSWLKSLKDRVQSQQRQDWKQENIEELSDFESAMMHIGGSFFGDNAGLDPNDTNVVKEQANLLLGLIPNKEWSEEDKKKISELKTFIAQCNGFNKVNRQKAFNLIDALRPQNMWKPSEGQLECLGYAIEKAEKDWSPLANNRIYLTLKALKEQLEKL